jgi:hypothetical protein
MLDAGAIEVGQSVYSSTRLGPGGDWPLGGVVCRIERHDRAMDDTGELETVEILWVRHSSRPLDRIRMECSEINPVATKLDRRAVDLLVRNLGEGLKRKPPGTSQRLSEREVLALEDVCHLLSRGAL